jgi:energy-converting hydrogenase Eha subunit F
MNSADEAHDVDPHNRKSNFGLKAWLVLALVLGIILLSAVTLAYRFTLPTDGWAVSRDDRFENIIYQKNLVGAVSPLQTGDRLIAVDGVSLGQVESAHPWPSAGWVVGKSIQYSIDRVGKRLDFTVPMVRWTVGAWLRYNTSGLSEIANILGAILLLAIGLFTFLKKPDNLAARALLIFCAASFGIFLDISLPDSLAMYFDTLASFSMFIPFIFIAVFMIPSLLTFNLVFPRPKITVQRHRWIPIAPYILGVLPVALVLAGQPPLVGQIIVFAMVIAAIASFAHSSLTQREAVSRVQLRWVFWGLVLGVILIFAGWINIFIPLNPLVASWISAWGALGPVVIGASLSVAILRYRLFDIDVIIRRTIVYGGLTLTLGGIYLISVAFFQQLIRGITRQDSSAAIVISTLVIAALFNPLRKRIQNDIDRLFFRSKYDAQKTLENFAAVARNQVELDELTALLLSVVDETLKPEYTSVWLPLETLHPPPIGAGDSTPLRNE